MNRFVLAFLAIALVSISTFAQNQSAPTLRVVTEDPNLPSELYYGDIKVKPVRLRPGTNQRITIDDGDFFVQQQYLDFLNRFPEPEGFAAWLGVLNKCGSDAACTREQRIEVSASFFRSEEFYSKGYFAYRFYRASLGRRPLYAEIVPDMRSVTGATPEEVKAKKAAFTNAWVQRDEFKRLYDGLAPAAFVDKLAQTAGVTLANRQKLVDDLTAGSISRADVVRAVVESPEVEKKEYNGAFVAMQYFGYLRRDPEPAGYEAWLRVIERNPEDYRTMVQGFMESTEYRNRF